MANKKMTLEEKLEEAIVKDAPYEVPENWVNIYFGSIMSIEGGTQPPKSQFLFEPTEGYIRLYQIRDFSSDNFHTYVKDEKKLRVMSEEDIMIARYGASIGKIFRGRKGAYNVALAKLIYSKELYDGNFLYWFLKSDLFQNNLGDMSRTAVAGFNKNDLKNFIVPLPPLKEQQRIVDKIESLFEKLDKAKELIEEARDDFEKRKAALLEKAFRGELTKEWRSKNLVDYNSTWTKQKFSDIAKVKSNLVQPQEFLKYPHIAPDNIEKNTGKILAYRTIEEDNVKSAKHRFYPGQIIYSKIRPYLSKLIIADFEGLCSADMYPIETDLDTKYLYYYMLSDTFVYFASNAGSRSVLPKINQEELGKINVPVCNINEQKQIVKILDNLLEKESKIEELTALEEQIELIKKSILAKAFRGQLGTNCKDDESALELLKEILMSNDNQ